MGVAGNKLDIYDSAQKVKDFINQVFTEYDEALPERQFVYVGEQPPHDCEQLVIGFIQHYSGSPGAQSQEESRCNDPRSVVFRVELVRSCAPGLVHVSNETTNRRYASRMEAPSSTEFEEDAKRKLIDATLLMEAGMRVSEATNVVGGMADVQVGPISGGFQAMILNVIMVVE